MGHRPVDVEPTTSESLSRPAELVQRAKQLAQLTNFQFGRNSVPMQVGQPPVTEAPAPAPAPMPAPMPAPVLKLAGANGNGNGHYAETVEEEVDDEIALAPSRPTQAPAPQPLPIPAPAPAPAPNPLPVRTTAQKIEDFYGVKQVGDEVVFAARFEDAKKVLIAGDFNNWTPASTPMTSSPIPGMWRMSLPLPKGRYRYRFVVDGKWVTDPNNQYVETNQFGELNNVVEVD
jgi:hypothetical protein